MNPTPTFRRLSSILPGLVLVLSLAVAIYDLGGVGSYLQNQVFDTYQRILPRQASSGGPHTVYVDIDADTAAKFGSWPWPRKRLADLVEAVRDSGASAILIDMPLSAADQTSASELLRLWTPLSTDPAQIGDPAQAGVPAQATLRAALETLPDQDARLVRLLQETSSIISFVPGKAPNGPIHAPLGAKPVTPQGSDPRHYLNSYDV
jgi:adenylate cyclase